MQTNNEKTEDSLLYTLLHLINHDNIRLYITVWKEMSESCFWRGCFEINEAVTPYLICMHAVEYGITEIQNCAGDL